LLFAFRADASPQTGSGHVARCRRLAARLRQEGHEILFLIRSPSSNLRSEIERDGTQIGILLNDSPKLSELDDAAASKVILADRRPDWLVVDNYALGNVWESAMRQSAHRLMVLDDLERPHDCDLLLDQGWLGDTINAYPSAKCEKLLGPRFALLSPEYAQIRSQIRVRNNEIQRLLVYFGGVDGTGQTMRVLEALDDVDFSHLWIDLVVGENNAHRDEIQRIATKMSNVNVVAPMETLAKSMRQADLFIGAGGTTTWERCCLGLPSIVCWTAINQKSQTLALDALGAHTQLGNAEEQTPESWRKALVNALKNPSRLDSQIKISMELVDGLGTDRVARRIAVPRIKLRSATAQDEQLLLQWANEQMVRENSFSKSTIAPDQHHVWLARKMSDSNTLILIGEANGVEIGQVRFDCYDESAILDISIDRQFRNKGYGVALLVDAIRSFRAAGYQNILKAYILKSNIASQRLFVAAGFSCDEQFIDKQGSYLYSLKGECR
jgi:UDP-2,4-diacetamido-2,4,6-trideoxy-beta-L-altropyranose hydrolase